MTKGRLGKSIGCIFIIVSAVIGAGMLALPLVGAGIGFIKSSILLILLWAVLLYSSMCILELTLALPRFHNSFYSMAKMTLGRFGQLLLNFSIVLLLYSIVGAYISGGGSILVAVMRPAIAKNLPPVVFYILFTLILGFFIFLNTKTVDYLLRGLMTLKGLLLILCFILLTPSVEPSLLAELRLEKSWILTLPIFLVTLYYGVIIPTLVNYVGDEPKLLLKSIIIGSLIPLALFIGWLAITLGIIPYEGPAGFRELIGQHQSVSGLLLALRARINEPLIYRSFDLFSNIALWASFLAIGLALFDYIADVFKRTNHPSHRLQTSLISFIPPLIFAIIYPQGFIYAMNFSGIAICILQLLLPSIMIYKLRKNPQVHSSFKAPFGSVGLFLLFAIGVILLIFSVINVILG